MSFCKYVLLGYLGLLTLVVSRKSDYKQIIFSDFVKDELEKNFKNDLKRADIDVLKLYEDYLREFELTNLTRLQPERHVGASRNITIENNRKKWFLLKTISKRRPLIFQIDDFLFDDECNHIIELAKKHGLEESVTTGEALEKSEGGGIDSRYDDVLGIAFEHADENSDSVVNVTELKRFIKHQFDTKMSEIVVRDLMKKSLIDFNLDGEIQEWEWNIKNITTFVMMVNASFQLPTSKARFSQQQWLEQTDSDDPILKSLHDRLYKVTGLPLKVIENSEPLQVVHYKPGGHYDCHLDSEVTYYQDDFKTCCYLTHDDQRCGACRFMTVLFFLDNTEHGGETAFPVVGVDPYENELADDSGGSVEDWCDLGQYCKLSKVVVKPKKGRAVLWYNHFLDPTTEWTGAVDRNSLHGGCAVHKGTKWIANNWINAGFHKKHDFLYWANSTVHGRPYGSFDTKPDTEPDTDNEDDEDESVFT